MKKWLSAFRLRTLPLALSSIILGSFLAYADDNFNSNITIFSCLTTVFLQILSNLANDYGDYQKGVDNSNRIGPTRALQSGSISKKSMLRAIVVFTIMSLVTGIYLVYIGTRGLEMSFSLGFLLLGLLAIGAAIKYTIGNNPYGYMGLGDLFVYLFFGLTGVMGTYFLHTHEFSWDLLLPASSIGLFSAAVLNLNNMRDRENDTASGKKTLVVKIGAYNAKIYHSLLLTGGLITAILYSLMHFSTPYQLIFLVVIPILISDLKIVWKHKNPATLDPELKKIALGTLLFSLTFGLGLIIEHV